MHSKFHQIFAFQKVLKQDIKKEPVLQFKFRAKFYPEGLNEENHFYYFILIFRKFYRCCRGDNSGHHSGELE